MEIEVLADHRRIAQPLQTLADERDAPGGRQFHDTQGADGVPGIAPRGGEGGEGVGERQRRPEGAFDGRLEAERLHGAVQHRPVHALLVSAAHFVPVVGRQLELGLVHRHLDLGQGHQVVETRFPRRFLFQEPVHLLGRRIAGQPIEQRIVLARAVLLQGVEPVGEAIDVRGGRRRLGGDLLAKALDPATLELAHLAFFVQRFQPVRPGSLGRQALVVPRRQTPVDAFHRRLRHVHTIDASSHRAFSVGGAERSILANVARSSLNRPLFLRLAVDVVLTVPAGTSLHPSRFSGVPEGAHETRCSIRPWAICFRLS